MAHLAMNGGNGKPPTYDWRDVTKVPRRSDEETAKVEAAKAKQQVERDEANRLYADMVKTGEIETREVPTFEDSVPCRHCGKPFQRCICIMPDETRDEYRALMKRQHATA